MDEEAVANEIEDGLIGNGMRAALFYPVLLTGRECLIST
jgi:hypothetical protein